MDHETILRNLLAWPFQKLGDLALAFQINSHKITFSNSRSHVSIGTHVALLYYTHPLEWKKQIQHPNRHMIATVHNYNTRDLPR